MFKKLLSNLPFNPSLIGQVAFYANRLRHESAIRRTGVLFLAAGLFIQTFAVISPPQPTLASSNNDLIVGGITSRDEAVQHCKNNTRNYQTILAYYGITCNDVASTTTTSLKSTDFNKQLYSMGHLRYGKAGETPVSIGGETLWLRYLWSWDTGPYSTYKALQGKTKAGLTYYILFNCGNLTFIGIPKPATTPKPAFTVVKSVRPHGSSAAYQQDVTVKPGAQVEFAIDIKNTGNTDFSSLTFKDVLPGGLTAVNGSLAVDGKKVSALLSGFNAGALKAGQSRQVTFVATVGSKVSACGTNRLINSASVAPDKLSPKADTATVQACQPTNAPTPTPTTTPTPTPTPEVCKYNSSLSPDDANCKPCEASQTSEDKTSCLVFAKHARNVTQNIADANGTTAQANDVIEYTLQVTNQGKDNIDNFQVQENISDVLDYADVTDLRGGNLDANKNLSWPAQTIKGNEKIERSFVIKIKSTIPSTPASSSDPGHFDLTMTNIYGNTVTVTLPGSTIKTAEIITGKLPNTGPGESLIMAFTLTVIASYFFARSRLYSKELDIVRTDFASTRGA